MEKSWGYELVINCGGCNDNIMSKEAVEKFSRDLVELIDMKAYGEPQVVYFAGHDPTKAGFTLVQLIETSSITAHFVDEYRQVYINIFSCKPFDPVIASDFVKDYFGAKDLKSVFMTRDVEKGITIKEV